MVFLVGMRKLYFPIHKNIKYSLIMIVAINLFSCLNSSNLSVSIINYLGLLYLVVLFFYWQPFLRI